MALPGAQVLLGFLLTLPFARRFGRTTQLERMTLFACLLLTVAGTLLLMAPSVYHRLRWGQGGKSDVVLMAHRLFLAGSSCLAAGIIAAVFLIGDVLFGTAAGLASVTLVAVTVAVTWYILPKSRSRKPSVRSRVTASAPSSPRRDLSARKGRSMCRRSAVPESL